MPISLLGILKLYIQKCIYIQTYIRIWVYSTSKVCGNTEISLPDYQQRIIYLVTQETENIE